MSQDLFRLPDLFDHFSEPVLFLDGARILYQNLAARQQFHELGSELPAAFSASLSRLGYEGQLTLPQGNFLVSSCELPGGRLLFLRASSCPAEYSLPVASNFSAQLRRCLNTLSLTIEQLGKADTPAQRRDLIATQSQNLHRLLRLARQLEFSQDEALRSFPQETVSLNALCEALVRDLRARLAGEAITLTLEAPEPPLLVSGSYALLEQLLLSLLSNAIKACGLSGSLGIRIQKKDRLAVLNVWDNGPGISQSRMSALFFRKDLDRLPLPDEGSGLDLWISHQIALLHGGVIMGGNRPEGGAEFTVSLPLSATDHLRLRSRDRLAPEEDFSPLLIALSDVLPARLYADIWSA